MDDDGVGNEGVRVWQCDGCGGDDGMGMAVWVMMVRVWWYG